MADPQDRTRLEGVSPDGRPRRQPPTIDVKAVEVSLDGAGATTAGAGLRARLSAALRWPKRMMTFLSRVTLAIVGWPKWIMRFLSPVTLAIAGSGCVIAAIIAGALWIYLAPDGSDGLQRNATSPAAVAPDVVASPAKPETALNAPPWQAAPDRDLANRMAALDARLASLGDRLAALERVMRDTPAAARVAGERADRGQAGEGREGAGDEQNSAQQHDRTAVEDLANRVATLESRQQTLQQTQEGLDRLASAMSTPDRTVRGAIVAAALRSAVERNRPFTAELAAARSLGLDERALASLAPFAATGLLTRDELFRELSTLVPELRRLAMPPGRDLGYLDRLQASAVKMLNIRPVRDEPGDDPAAVLSRIEFKMAQQDIEAMVAELDKLPAPARDVALAWRTKALARQGAVEAARLVATASLAKLGEPAAGGLSRQ